MPMPSGIFQPCQQDQPAWTIGQLLEYAKINNQHLMNKLTKHPPHAQELCEQAATAAEREALGLVRSGRDWLVEARASGNIVFCRKFPVLQRKSLKDDLDLQCTPAWVEEVRSCMDPLSSPGGSSCNGA